MVTMGPRWVHDRSTTLKSVAFYTKVTCMHDIDRTAFSNYQRAPGSKSTAPGQRAPGSQMVTTGHDGPTTLKFVAFITNRVCLELQTYVIFESSRFAFFDSDKLLAHLEGWEAGEGVEGVLAGLYSLA